MWIARKLHSDLERAAKTRPVVLLTGARQTGKSSLLAKVFPNAEFITLDRPAITQAALESPDQFLNGLSVPAVLDEVQYAPNLFRAIKPRVDENRQTNGQYILTGSQRFQLMEGIGESLAGRLRILELGTLSAAELRAAGINIAHFHWRGGYPELWSQPEELLHKEFFEDYIATYLERDLHQIINVASLRDFRRFMQACAIRVGQLMNFTDLAKDVGITANTAKRWVNALDAGGLIHVLSPFYTNIGKRLTKAPKLYFADHGLLAHLLNTHSQESWASQPLRGALWENLVLCELVKTRQLKTGSELFFYRDQNGVEIDFLVDQGNQLELIEAKASEQPNHRKLNFSKVVPLFPKHQIECFVACDTQEKIALKLGKYWLVNPVFHDWPVV